MRRKHTLSKLLGSIAICLAVCGLTPAVALATDANVVGDQAYMAGEEMPAQTEQLDNDANANANTNTQEGAPEAAAPAADPVVADGTGEGDVQQVVESDEQSVVVEAQTQSAPDTVEVVAQDQKADDAKSAGASLTAAQDEKSSGKATISGRAYVQRKAWMPWENNVAPGSILTLGTTGQSLRMEGLCISLNCDGLTGGVAYQGHVQRKGWMDVVENGAYAGTKGKSLRLEALRLKLTGDAANVYDIWYRVHVSGVGWLAWTSNWADAGTAGFSKRVEAIQVTLMPKGSAGPANDGQCELPFVSYRSDALSYASLVKGSWQDYVHPAKVSGTTGKSTPVRGIRASWDFSDGLMGSLEYRAHISRYGWTSWLSPEEEARDGNNTVEAVGFRLSGDLSKFYDVWYRAHVSKAGWLGWAKNGAPAGSTGASKKLEAYQVRILPKGYKAPGSTTNSCVGKSYFEDAMTRKAQGYSSDTNYLIMVDVDGCRVGIYQGSQGSWNRIKDWVAAVGAYESPTIKGVYSTSDKGYEFGDGYSCYYWTRFSGPYLFHTVLYDKDTFNIQDGTLGAHVSAGCVRLPIENAKWIYDCIPYGTTVVSY
ncbi:MAG: L,D-transpeptidase family protein [Coriobacteriales bacterium]|nr:L,D-transpeptidase family protein [Coriobacteriales bacterium]